MRTRIIPAQITTVEDKIAGNLNMTQIGLLILPVFLGTLTYCFFPPHMHFAIYKVIAITLILIICIALSLRIKDKVVINWLSILFRYNLRPGFYVFNKNDIHQREIYAFTNVKKTQKQAILKKEAKVKNNLLSKDLMKIKEYLKNPDYALSLKPNRKGGFYVALDEIQK